LIFYSRDKKCLLRGTDWVFKKSSLRFVFKGLIYVTNIPKNLHIKRSAHPEPAAEISNYISHVCLTTLSVVLPCTVCILMDDRVV